MGDKVRWPGKLRTPAEQRNSNKWCEFHGDHGHTVTECIALRLEVAELLKRGHLTEFLSDKGKKTLANRQGADPPEPPQTNKVINVISGGSEISGISYSAAKRQDRKSTRLNSSHAQ